MNRSREFVILAATFAVLVMAIGIVCPQPLQAQAATPKFQVDPSWPRPLPERWIVGTVGGVCVDSRDHVFVLNWRDLTNLELDAGEQAPPVMEFDSEGNMVNGWKDPDALPGLLHGCYVDKDNNVWMTGQEGSIVQKWSHDGSKLLLQLGKKGVFDTRDGTSKGAPTNSSKTAFYNSSGMVTDPKNGDIYVADSKGNWRVAVFDPKGEFQRQWSLNTSPLEGKLLSFNVETREGLVGFRGQLHQDASLPRAVLEAYCLTMDKDGNVYVCDRFDNRVQIYDKAGNYRKSIEIPFESKSPSPRRLGGEWGTVRAVAFSPDPAQKYMYIVNEDNDRIEILDRATGQILSNFGRVGHQMGDFTHAQSVAVDSRGNLYVGEAGVLGGEATTSGHRVQKFKIAP
jgi:hypothetical protein